MWPTLTILGFLGTACGCWLWWRQRQARTSLEHRLKEAQAEQRKLEDARQHATASAEAQRAALLNSMGEGVLLLDEEGRIQLVNRAFESLFHLKGDVRGRNVLEALRSHELDELVQRTRASGQVFGAEMELPGLEPRSLQVNAASISNGRTHGMILVFHDLTRLKQLENVRKEFVANVSHELRTPLSLIKGYVETLLDGAKDDPALAARFLQTIAKHTDRLTYLIEDLLTISRLESGPAVLSLLPTAVRELASRTVDDLASRAASRKITLANEVPAALTARADANRVQQVLFNLVDNAIKYGRPEGRVVVGGRAAGEEFVELWVRDDGPGIPAEALGRIFERFYRVDRNRSREQGGTGLGLAIVKHIVQSHGGEVRVESEPGKGATFYFKLPRG